MKEFRLYIFRLIFIACSIMMMASCNEKKQFDGYLYPIRENGLYGYIDSVGNRIIEPEFLWVSTFHNGLAMAVVDTIYRVVPDSIAYEVGERDTIINLYQMYAKYGYINKFGKFVIEPKFVSYVTMPEIGFVAKDIDDCSNALYRHSFRNGRAMFCDTTTWKDGYIDTKGNIAIEAKYYYSEPFSDGVAVVRDAIAEPIFTNGACINSSKLRCAYIDTLGNNVTEFKYETLTRCLSKRGIGTYKVIHKESVELGDTTVQIEEYSEPRFLVNNCGNEIKELNFVFKYYGYSRDGITVALHDFLWKIGGNKEYFFFDKEGNRLEPLKGLSEYQLDSLSRCNDIIQVLPDNAVISETTFFNEGFAGISPDGKHWFVIDKYLLIHGYGDESIFDDFHAFENGLAAVKRNGKWGYINKKIEEQIPCKYDSCGLVYPYLEEVFEYNTQGEVKKKAYISRKDSLVWESPLYDSEKIENRYSIKNNKDWGKWTYSNTHFLYNIILWLLISFGLLLFISITGIVIYICLSKKQKNGRTEESVYAIHDENINTSETTKETEEDNDDLHFYPSVGQYTETIKMAAKAPDEYFNKLCNLHPILDAEGNPIMSSGNFAVVFKMVDEKGKFHALRCFHRAQQGRERNYKLICEELAKLSSPYLSPIKYYDKELFVESDEYPVLLMDWIEGMTLDKYIRKIINDKKALSQLAINFKSLAIWLLNQPFAHGDLKPDNILVKNDGSLVLVDYDGMFVPAMQGQKAREIGSPDYRNPSRTEDDFNKDIDNFPIVSILLSLELIAEKSEYLERFGKDDRLLFSHDDYLNLRGSGIFKRALTSYADDIPELAVMLERMVNGEPRNVDNVKKLLHTNNWYERLQPNKEIERKASWFVGGWFILVLFLPLYLRSVICWHIVMLYVTIFFLTALMWIILVFVDRLRPNKKEHIGIIGNEGPVGFFGWINFIPLLLMADFFTDWFNSILPFLSQPYYEGEWYITALMWIIWWYSGMAIISTPKYLLEWRLKHFKTQEEAIVEQTEQELSTIRAEVEEEEEEEKRREKELKEMKKRQRRYGYYDDLPFLKL